MKKTVGAIIGGSPYSGDLYSLIKRHPKQAKSGAPNFRPSDSPTDHIISFHEKEVIELCQPHDDALVIYLPIANCHVGGILVDNGSPADILFLSTIQEMDIAEMKIQKVSIILVEFNNEGMEAIGNIQLPAFVRGENRVMTFLVMDCPSSYNIILG